MHLPAGKVEELYASLKKKNADIYIQRSQRIASSSPPRTRLFAWNMTDVEIMVSRPINFYIESSICTQFSSIVCQTDITKIGNIVLSEMWHK